MESSATRLFLKPCLELKGQSNRKVTLVSTREIFYWGVIGAHAFLVSTLTLNHDNASLDGGALIEKHQVASRATSLMAGTCTGQKGCSTLRHLRVAIISYVLLLRHLYQKRQSRVI